VSKISVLLHATPDTKIEMVPTQNPSKRAATTTETGERAAPPAPSPRRHSTPAIPRRRASKTALVDPVEFVVHTPKRARTAAQAPSSEAGSPTTNARQYTFMPSITTTATSPPASFPPHPVPLGCITHFNEPHMQYPPYSAYQCPEIPNNHSQPSFPVSGSVDSHHPRRMSIDQLVYHADPLASPTSPPANRLTSEMESLVIWANLERQQLTSNHSN